MLPLGSGFCRPLQFVPVLLGLVGIKGAEFGQSFREAVTGADVAGQNERIAGAGVAASQQLAADLGISLEAAAGQIL